MKSCRQLQHCIAHWHRHCRRAKSSRLHAARATKQLRPSQRDQVFGRDNVTETITVTSNHFTTKVNDTHDIEVAADGAIKA